MVRIVLGFVLAALVVPPAGSAHNTRWYWSASLAESKISHSRWAIDNSVITYTIDCLPAGTWIWSDRRPRQKLYRHFDCRFSYNDYDDQGYSTEYETVMRLHVLGADRFVMLNDAP